MQPHSQNSAPGDPPGTLSRRETVRGIIAGGGFALFTGPGLAHTAAQEGTPASNQCVASAPPIDETGIAFVPLVTGVVRDMPAGPVEVRISRLAMLPGTVIDPGAAPYPALMYIETGTTACPGAAGRIVYAPDGALVEESTTEGVQYTPAGSLQYIPAGIPDGAGNEGNELMSSIILEFVPATGMATPTG